MPIANRAAPRAYRDRVPRLKRSWLPDGGFHVSVRGNHREPIFRTSGDAQKLLRLTSEVSDRWELKTYCLMPNHFHLVVFATVENLMAAMKRVNGGYTQWFNRKYDLSGHLFQGRYNAKPIADEKHLYESIRYVLLNPVDAGLCSHPAEWPWSNWNEQSDYVRLPIDDALRARQWGQAPDEDCPLRLDDREPSAFPRPLGAPAFGVSPREAGPDPPAGAGETAFDRGQSP